MQSHAHLPIRNQAAALKRAKQPRKPRTSRAGWCAPSGPLGRVRGRSGGGGSHLEPVLQVRWGVQARPLGQLRARTAGDSRDTLLLLRCFLLRSKRGDGFSSPHGRKFQVLLKRLDKRRCGVPVL